MKHVVDGGYVTIGEDGFTSAAAACQARQQDLIRQSNRSAYRLVASLFACVYAVALIASAAFLRLFRRASPSPLHRRLAEIYYYVPEMALHKSIELEALLDHAPDLRGKGLDLGCGSGLVGGVLIKEAKLQELHGIDLNAHNEALALTAGYAGFRQGDIQALEHPHAPFDYAVSICVIEHVADLPGVLSGVARSLRPGARFLFTTTAPLFRDSTLGYRLLKAVGLKRKAERSRQHKDVRTMQYHYLSPEQWQKILREAGFEDIRLRGIFSRRQLLVYDLMNIQVNWLSFYFADKLAVFLSRHGRARGLMQWATERCVAALSKDEVTTETATHYLVQCRRRVT